MRMWSSTLLIDIFPLAVLGFLLHRRAWSNVDEVSLEGLDEGSRRWILNHPKAFLLPSRTTHARIFPEKHAFVYSYLLCGFPVVPARVTADGEEVGDGKDGSLGSWWLRIRAEDYLFRGQGALGFYGKLKAFLREQNVDDTEWSYAYLVTAPRFFDYSFNPVSFWYIYDQSHDLKKMILEVNNTFGERRMYLLDGSSPPAPPQTPDSELSAHSNASKSRFADVWTKDFHVSPFNSRKGAYALKALDPFPSACFAHPQIDNTITLKSSKDYAKLVARVFTTGQPIESANMSMLDTMRFVSSWWWVGFVTFPRIIREAGKLYFKRGLHVWFRPEVLEPSISRAPTQIEDDLQSIFQDYLRHIVENSSEAIEVDYKTAIPDRPEQRIVSAKARHAGNVKKLELRIATPAFYSRFVHYAHTSEALDRECLFTDVKNRTLWISQPELLPHLFTGSKTKPQSNAKPSEAGFFDELRWTILRKLRCPPPEPAYMVTPTSAEFGVNDIRTLPYSELDSFVRSHEGVEHRGAYRRAVTKIFLAQRFAFGFTEIIDAMDFALRIALCWVGSAKVAVWAQAVGQLEGPVRIGWGWVSSVVIYLCGCHIYGLLK